MKQHFTAITISILTVFVVGCSETSQSGKFPKSDVELMGLKGQVKTLLIKNKLSNSLIKEEPATLEYTFNRAGMKTLEVYSSEQITYKSKWDYYPNNELKKTYLWDEENGWMDFQMRYYTYDKQHRKIKKITTFFGGNEETTTYTWNDENQIIKEKMTTGANTYELKFGYDDSGNQVSEFLYQDGKLSIKHFTKYNSQNKVVWEKFIDQHGSIFKKQVYGKSGEEIQLKINAKSFRNEEAVSFKFPERIIEFSSGKLIATSAENRRKFDHIGNWVKVETKYNDGSNRLIERKITYFE